MPAARLAQPVWSLWSTCAQGGQSPACTQLWLCGPAVCLQGAKLSRARVRWFKHNDMQSLEALLQQIEAEERATR